MPRPNCQRSFDQSYTQRKDNLPNKSATQGMPSPDSCFGALRRRTQLDRPARSALMSLAGSTTRVSPSPESCSGALSSSSQGSTTRESPSFPLGSRSRSAERFIRRDPPLGAHPVRLHHFRGCRAVNYWGPSGTSVVASPVTELTTIVTKRERRQATPRQKSDARFAVAGFLFRSATSQD